MKAIKNYSQLTGKGIMGLLPYFNDSFLSKFDNDWLLIKKAAVQFATTIQWKIALTRGRSSLKRVVLCLFEKTLNYIQTIANVCENHTNIT